MLTGSSPRVGDCKVLTLKERVKLATLTGSAPLVGDCKYQLIINFPGLDFVDWLSPAGRGLQVHRIAGVILQALFDRLSPVGRGLQVAAGTVGGILKLR